MRPPYLYSVLVALLLFPLFSGAQTIGQVGQPLVEEARAAAKADRNAESARLFGEALAQQPSLHDAVLREYADQLTYSGSSRRAVPLYRAVLQRPDLGRDEEIRTRLGLALALSWSDRNADARREYEEVLRIDPANVEGQRSLARVQSWRGRQREARRTLQQFLASHPGDREGRWLLAQAESWSGRTELAAAELESLVAEDLHNQQATRLLDDIRRSFRPSSRLYASQSTQSDRLDIAQQQIRQDWVFRQGLFATGVRYGHTELSRRGASSVYINRFEVSLRDRLTDRLELNAHPAFERIDARNGRFDDVTWSSWLTYWAADSWRVDLSSSRASIDNLRSLESNILTTSTGLSADFTPDELTRLTPRIAVATYSDGNRRSWQQLEAERRVINGPQLLIGARATSFNSPGSWTTGTSTRRAIVLSRRPRGCMAGSVSGGSNTT